MYDKFSKYVISKDNNKVETVFTPATVLPDIPVSTPFTFPRKDRKYMLALDKMGWWNPLGGHVELNETWIETLKREAYEEAGIKIGNIKLFGYVTTKNITPNASRYPQATVLPMTYSDILEVDRAWKPKETSERALLTDKEVQELLLIRKDNNQMYEIFNYLNKYLDE